MKAFASIWTTLTVSILVKAQYRGEMVYHGSLFAGFQPHNPTAAEFLLGDDLHQTPARPTVDLFTPNTLQQPAETPGQVENYTKALEEEARDAAAYGLQDGTISYVSVNVAIGVHRYDYQYMF